MNLRRLNLSLLILGIALGVMLALLQTRVGEVSSAEASEEQRRQDHADVTRAATMEVQAFLGIDHQSVDEQAQIVLEGATGDFKRQYAAELDNLKRSARDQRSSAVATVLQVGIRDIDASAATVAVAANTDVTSRATDSKSRTVAWRIQLDMVKEGGRWLTSGLQFVG